MTATGRPRIRVLVAMTGIVRTWEPVLFLMVNLLDIEQYRDANYVIIGPDPEDVIAFRQWEDEHSDAA